MKVRVQPALKKEGRRTNHYHYAETDWQPLMQALDPEWPGGVPHTILLAPDGRILWRHSGELERIQHRYEQPIGNREQAIGVGGRQSGSE